MLIVVSEHFNQLDTLKGSKDVRPQKNTCRGFCSGLFRKDLFSPDAPQVDWKEVVLQRVATRNSAVDLQEI